jgi:hypothetical protein
MGLFSRRKDPDRDLAAAIAKRGVRARGKIEAVDRDGEHHVFTVTFPLAGPGGQETATIRQRMTRQALVGLEPGEPVDISYDEADPAVAIVWGSPNYTVTEAGDVVRRVDLAAGDGP